MKWSEAVGARNKILKKLLGGVINVEMYRGRGAGAIVGICVVEVSIEDALSSGGRAQGPRRTPAQMYTVHTRRARCF